MVRSPIDRATVPMRRAISPRLAMSSERNMSFVGRRTLPCPDALEQASGWHRGAAGDMVPPPMKVVTVYLRIYADALRQALTGIGKNAWTVLLPMVLLVGNNFASALVLGIPYLGQFLVWVVWAAAASCYLYFVGEVVAKSRVKLDEFGRSIGAY